MVLDDVSAEGYAPTPVGHASHHFRIIVARPDIEQGHLAAEFT
jgi:hypothetical protein